MEYVNKATIVGFLDRDAESRQTAKGNTMTNLRVRTEKSYGEKVSKEWHNVVIFSPKTAEEAAGWRKGAAVQVEGEIQTRSWEKDGVKRYSTEIVVTVGGSAKRIAGDDTPPTPKKPAIPDELDDEIPF